MTTSTNEWQQLAEGLDQRLYTSNQADLAQLLVLRIDPAHYTFRVHYRPGDPQPLRTWVDTLPNPTAVINSNFFTPQYQVLGLLIADGLTYGGMYTDRGGTFGMQDGRPGIWSNQLDVVPVETLRQAIQAFPMLVRDGEQSYTVTQGDRITRRTAIGIDEQGRVLLIATPFLGLRLADLSAFLANADLQLVDAFNLDGGGSTMMYIGARASEFVTSLAPVPAVLAVYPR
jgi:uncharacterized protein YigE (DUF2233 family)